VEGAELPEAASWVSLCVILRKCGSIITISAHGKNEVSYGNHFALSPFGKPKVTQSFFHVLRVGRII